MKVVAQQQKLIPTTTDMEEDYAHVHALFHYQNAINNYKENIKSKLGTLVKSFTAFITYLCFGSLLFYYIEQCAHVTAVPISGPLEVGIYKLCEMVRWNDSAGGGFITNETLRAQLKMVCEQSEAETTMYECELTGEAFVRWFEYVITIAFTIGYGQVVCYSTVGKLVTIIYAIPAIAITIKFYVCAGQILVTLTKIMVLHIEIKQMRRKYVHLLEWKILIIQILLSLVFWMLLVACNVPLTNDNISVLDVVYLTFITLTTIGFGDLSYTFSQAFEQPHIFILTFVFYIFGVGALASVLTELSQLGTKEIIVCEKCISYETSFKRKTLHRHYMSTGLSPSLKNMPPLQGMELADKFVTIPSSISNGYAHHETKLHAGGGYDNKARERDG